MKAPRLEDGKAEHCGRDDVGDDPGVPGRAVVEHEVVVHDHSLRERQADADDAERQTVESLQVVQRQIV